MQKEDFEAGAYIYAKFLQLRTPPLKDIQFIECTFKPPNRREAISDETSCLLVQHSIFAELINEPCPAIAVTVGYHSL